MTYSFLTSALPGRKPHRLYRNKIISLVYQKIITVKVEKKYLIYL